MNHPIEPSDESQMDDALRRGLASPNEFELRLKQLKPRIPQLDVALIEQAASELKTNTPLTATVLQGGTNRSVSHLAGPLAASWICGVVVGALCVFFTMPSGTTQTNLDKTAEVPILEPNETKVTIETNTKLAGSERSEQPTGLDDEGAMRLTGRYVKASEWMNPRELTRRRFERVSTTDGISEVTTSIFEAGLSQYTPPPPITQAELMRELRLESLQIVH